jgi:NAD(P)-dependent dehydrogenase (short-subunit alcohol dehydrogenase family)
MDIHMPPLLNGKVALISGAGSGIGQAAALALAREGAAIVIADREPAGGATTLEMLKARGGHGLAITIDTSVASQVEALIQRTVDEYGRLDCAVNNAGIQGQIASTADCTEENWDRIVSVNLKGVWLCLKYEIAQMLRQGGGAIVNVSSNFGLVGSRGMPAYTASKHGVIGLTKTAALEYARHEVRVNAVCPGPTRTPLLETVLSEQPEIVAAIEAAQPIGRIGRAQEIAEAILWLCSDSASFVTGAALSVDGGYVTQ